MSVSLKVEERAVRPRSLRNQLRHSGKVPAVVYGYKVESTPITVDEKELVKAMRDHGANAVFTFKLGGQTVNTLIYKTQLDTFTSQIKHVEFLAVNMNEVTELDAEVSLVGESKGVKSGGVLAQNLYSVLVSATPDLIPERVEVDITNLEIGDSITVADLPKNPDFDIVTDPEEQIVIIEAPVSASAEEPGEPGEPEVIGEKE